MLFHFLVQFSCSSIWLEVWCRFLVTFQILWTPLTTALSVIIIVHFILPMISRVMVVVVNANIYRVCHQSFVVHMFKRHLVKERCRSISRRIIGRKILRREVWVLYLLIYMWHPIVMVVDRWRYTEAHLVSRMIRDERLLCLLFENGIIRFLS